MRALGLAAFNGMGWFCWLMVGLGWPLIGQEFTDFDSKHAEGLSSEQIASGWISLFDGKTLFGWRREVDADFQVDRHAIVAGRGPVGLIRTGAQFDDFELHLEFLADRKANGGIFVRTSPRPSSPIRDACEINIAPDSHPYPTGSVVGWSRTETPVAAGNWNQMAIRAEGPRIRVWVNGQQSTDVTLRGSYPQKGFIGLQHHSGQVRYRNIILKPLNVKPVFDGRSLEGWSVSHTRDCKPQITPDGHLRLVGGPGQLESADHYRDFILSAQIKTNAEGVNSGIFFRCLPNEWMNGYESQIDHRCHDGDLQRPLDFGTGGIFRRQAARRVNAADRKWFAKTIVVDGATICVWVNGFQVVDWTDQRRKHKNPRRGLRLAAGPVILQGHDSHTDVSFRTVGIRELNRRRK